MKVKLSIEFDLGKVPPVVSDGDILEMLKYRCQLTDELTWRGKSQEKDDFMMKEFEPLSVELESIK
jgi:hypothetical protein